MNKSTYFTTENPSFLKKKPEFTGPQVCRDTVSVSELEAQSGDRNLSELYLMRINKLDAKIQKSTRR